ncbi:hypothetical protein OUQ99_29160 [Streptomonospora nanhaiensis]|uniref:Secreted protein n=1 Tax=Streptomonospora nanhaiensis TaxID=1323731 RepID=A0ABY6YLU3_9ACTN|nr:hypothetical protein [Streptomonospora nanhaiensis]WAE73176.1 hypothetical protein OUQ99_29160 [Streptomonospora nanhaiensis]
MPPDSDQELGRDRPGSPPAPSGASPARGARDAGAVVGPPALPGGADTRTGGYARDRVAGARRWLRTTPARVWLLTVVCLVSVAGLFGSATLTLNQAREGLDVVGHGAGPQAMTTTDLYLALADMDAQLADILLMGTDHGLGSGRDEAVERYEESRSRANEALLQAASLIEDNAEEGGAGEAATGEDGAGEGRAEERSVQELDLQAVLDGMGEYEQLATDARLRNDEAQAPPGEVDATALVSYRQATRLMHTELLPKAFNVSLDSSAIIRAHHEEGQSAVALGLVWVGSAGVVTLVSLVGLQLYLRVRFRRRVNVPVLAATAGTLLLTAGVVLALVTSGEHQRDAKEEGLDAAMALSRAGAISTDMQADQSRYLVDPTHADNYQQVYLERAQQVLFRPADNLEDYYAAIDEVAAASSEQSEGGRADGDAPVALGYLGENAGDSLLPGQEGALADVLVSYNALQDRDRELRAAVEAGDLDSAVAVRMEIAHAEDGAFRAYEQALDELTGQHKEAFTAGIARGDSALAPWSWLLPVGALALLALVVLGVRPRLAEYR